MWMCYKTPLRKQESEKEVTKRMLGMVETGQDLPDETERLRDREMRGVWSSRSDLTKRGPCW